MQYGFLFFSSHWFIFPYWKKSRAVEVGGDGRGEEEGDGGGQAVPGGVLMAQLHSQRVFLLVPSTRNKNEPRVEPIPDSSLHSSAVFTMTTGPTRWTIHAFPPSPSHMEIKGNTALQRQRAQLQVQSHSVFWNVQDRGTSCSERQSEFSIWRVNRWKASSAQTI